MNLGEKLKDLMPYVQQLQIKEMLNREIETVLKVESKRLQVAKDGKKFLLMTLSDRTGSIRAVDWHNAEVNDERIKEGDVLTVRGKLVFFDGRYQINVGRELEDIRVLAEGEFDPERFVKRAERDPEDLYRDLMRFVDTVRDRDYRELLRAIFRSFREELLKAPAAMRLHHAYIGGLMEHSLTVARIVDFVSKIYKLDRDLAVTGALLHDIGKIKEYHVGSTGIEVTTEGELKGHIVMGVEIIREFARKMKMDRGKLLKLEHIIISHHGEFEMGSPVVPKTLEAMVVHFVENMDSKVARMMEIAKNSDSGKEWSDYDRNLGRRIFLGGDDREIRETP